MHLSEEVPGRSFSDSRRYFNALRQPSATGMAASSSQPESATTASALAYALIPSCFALIASSSAEASSAHKKKKNKSLLTKIKYHKLILINIKITFSFEKEVN